ncbi:MFS transporter [Nocardioides plantarum]|uniref:MFS transporter n=1 Tax=Nocardioides plantarum TaxID=29299 RepID=A0ABV5K4J5_9ACTN|nr:MFS transporter [Nocardioides plantarum]
MPSYRHLARNRDFTALWVSQTVSSLGSRMSMFVFPLLAYALTGSTVMAALAETVHLLGLAGTLLPAGVLADRVDRLRVMRFSSGTGVLLYASLAVAGVAGHLGLAHLLVVSFLTGACAGLFAPAETSAVRSVVDTEDLTTALSQNQAREHVAGLLGAPVGGALYAVARWLPFAADAASYAVSWLLLGRIRTDLSPVPLAPGEARPRVRDDLRAGAGFVLSRPFFRTMLVWSALTNLAVNALFFVAVLRLIAAGVDPVHLGLVETAAGAAGILGAIIAPWIIEGVATGRLTVVIAWSFLPLLVPMALWNSPVVVAGALAIVLLLNPAGNAGIGAYRIAVTPRDLLGRTQSFSQFASMSVMPLAPVLAGLALTLLGGEGAVLALGVLVAVVALVPTLSRTVRSVPRPAVWRAELADAEADALVTV